MYSKFWLIHHIPTPRLDPSVSSYRATFKETSCLTKQNQNNVRNISKQPARRDVYIRIAIKVGVHVSGSDLHE